MAISIMIAVSLSACTHPNKSKTVDLESHSTVSVEYPLPETESIDLDKVHFPVIKLTGKHQVVDEGFIDMNGATILKKDNYLIVRNAEKGWENHCYLVYSLPDFRLVKKFAKRGGGPDELGTSGGISTSDSDRLIGHIYDSA
ncbi:MAG: TolB-like 6-bladed beta-propeller domain-containing protein, partial [Prevotella sp.]|nr:TolB-like 6-bladed beta-propeller domain-containing protein [Prevotella sp.]